MRRLLPPGLVALLLALPLGAQSPDALDGPWTFEQETPRGTVTHTVTFTLDEEGWMGTMTTDRCSFDLQEVALHEGQVSFSFPAGPPSRRGVCPRTSPAPPEGDGTRSPVRASFEGVLEGDRITGEMTGPRGSRPLVLIRGHA